MKTTTFWPRQVTGLGILLSILAATVPALADDDLVEVTEGQLDLNERGIEAITDGEYDRAIRLFEASIDLGELNVTYTNLARAYQHDDQCEKAQKYYDKALEAPRAEEPTPDQIEAAIEHYRAEMTDHCPGYLEVECRPEQMDLFVGGEGPTKCSADTTHTLSPKAHDLRGEYKDYVATTAVEIEAMETSSVTLELAEQELEEIRQAEEEVDELPVADEPSDDAVAEIETPDEPERDTTRAWLMLTGSALTLAGGVALDTIPESSRNGEINAINFVPVGLYGASLGLAWGGIRAAW